MHNVPAFSPRDFFFLKYRSSLFHSASISYLPIFLFIEVSHKRLTNFLVYLNGSYQESRVQAINILHMSTVSKVICHDTSIAFIYLHSENK